MESIIRRQINKFYCPTILRTWVGGHFPKWRKIVPCGAVEDLTKTSEDIGDAITPRLLSWVTADLGPKASRRPFPACLPHG